MYTVVMMMAMSGAVDLPERGKCCSCSCSCSCKGKRSRGCHGCCSCYGCYGCHGCYAGCYGGCYGGCYAGCYGGVIVAPPAKTKMTSGEAPATIRVSLPADATLSVDGAATTSRSAERIFQSPPLAENQEYVYTLRAEIVREGRTVAQTQRITVRGGQETNVPFNFAASEVASSR